MWMEGWMDNPPWLQPLCKAGLGSACPLLLWGGGCSCQMCTPTSGTGGLGIRAYLRCFTLWQFPYEKGPKWSKPGDGACLLVWLLLCPAAAPPSLGLSIYRKRYIYKRTPGFLHIDLPPIHPHGSRRSRARLLVSSHGEASLSVPSPRGPPQTLCILMTVSVMFLQAWCIVIYPNLGFLVGFYCPPLFPLPLGALQYFGVHRFVLEGCDPPFPSPKSLFLASLVVPPLKSFPSPSIPCP